MFEFLKSLFKPPQPTGPPLQPDLIKLNLVIEGKGRLWTKDVELLQTPLM